MARSASLRVLRRLPCHSRAGGSGWGTKAQRPAVWLLPIWISAYRYMNKVYRFYVNARTGEVHGARPYSYWKITFLVLAILATVAVIALIASSR